MLNLRRSSQSVSITEEDKQKFPDLFASKKQLQLETKINIGKSMRNKLKSLKSCYLEDKINKEKEMVKERFYFEELLEKYQKYRKDGEELPFPLTRNARSSLSYSSQPALATMSVNKVQSSLLKEEHEIRLPLSNNKFEDMQSKSPGLGGTIKSIKKTQKLLDKDLESTSASKRSKDKLKVSPNQSPVKDRSSLGSRNRKNQPMLSARLRQMSNNDNSRSVNNLSLSAKANKTTKLKIDISKISTIDELDDSAIESHMRSLPHWKYASSFDSYMQGFTLVTPDVKDEFMKLYKKKDYK